MSPSFTSTSPCGAHASHRLNVGNYPLSKEENGTELCQHEDETAHVAVTWLSSWLVTSSSWCWPCDFTFILANVPHGMNQNEPSNFVVPVSSQRITWPLKSPGTQIFGHMSQSASPSFVLFFLLSLCIAPPWMPNGIVEMGDPEETPAWIVLPSGKFNAFLYQTSMAGFGVLFVYLIDFFILILTHCLYYIFSHS